MSQISSDISVQVNESNGTAKRGQAGWACWQGQRQRRRGQRRQIAGRPWGPIQRQELGSQSDAGAAFSASDHST